MDEDRSNLARFLHNFRLYEVTVAVVLFVNCLRTCLYCLLVCSELVPYFYG